MRKDTRSKITIAIVIALGLAFNISFAVLNRTGFGVDFNQFFSASRLVGTGHLYDWNALRKIERENGLEVPTARLPVVVYGIKILGGLPYPTARALWMAASLAALIVFAAWPGSRSLLMLGALAWSMPATMVVLFGQDVPFWLMFFTVGLLLLERKSPWLSGIAFSLCICKFHLALGLPVMLAAQKRWRTLIAGAVSVLVLIGACFLIEGPGWPQAYVKITQIPEFSPAPERMPSLFGIASWLPGTTAIEIACALAIVLLLWAACRSSADLGMSGAAAAACGVLLAHHTYAGDCALLIPLSVLTIQRQTTPRWLRIWAVVSLSPMPTLLLVSDRPYLGQLFLAAFIVTAIAAWKATPLSKSAPPFHAVPDAVVGETPPHSEPTAPLTPSLPTL